MDASLNWLKAYVPGLNPTDHEFMDAMTLSGTKTEGFTRLDKNLEKIVVGEIVSIERHPDADKLVVCQVNIGKETIQIVTGAPNVLVGQKVPVVLDGGKVAGGHDGSPLPEDGIKIKKGKLRGVESFGMMCSVEELGQDRNAYPDAPENGIYILPADLEPGTDAIEYLGLHDTVFEYEVTSNRVDCFGILGIAREAAATYRLPFKAPVVPETGNKENVNDYLKVSVKDTDLCPRYVARVVKNIKLGPSPWWMQRRLAAMGIRPINNIVDITNYVMEEYGQPMHAFDYDQLAGQEIIVRRAKNGETFETLDEQERKLDENVLMICDGEKEIAIAGIMGGQNSKITDDVKTMVFEAATFDGTNIRLSARRVGLRTDASGKFEKGLDPENALEAMNRACALVEELGCGEVVGGVIDVYPNPVQKKRIPFDVAYINHLLGTNVTKEECLNYFKPLELEYDEKANELIIPTFRQDLIRKCDIAEEVARFFGYDKIPTTLPAGEATAGKKPFELRVEDTAQKIAEFAGFSQGYCYSFESPKNLDRLCIPQGDVLRNVIPILNPLGEDFSIMRTQTLNGMLTSLSTNYNHRNKNVKLYEIASIYLPKALPLTELPDERKQFTLGFYGDGDFFTLKGVVEDFAEALGMYDKMKFDPKSNRPSFHPGRQANIYYKDTLIGFMGEIHPDVLDAYDIGEKAYVAVLDLPAIVPFATYDRKYETIVRFPAVSRDLSMVVKKEMTVGEIEEVMEKKAGKILEDLSVFDVYEGAQIGAGFKSVAFNLTFRSKDHTLTEEEITSAMDRILKGLADLGIQLRA